MNMLKKMLVLVLGMSLILSLTGCATMYASKVLEVTQGYSDRVNLSKEEAVKVLTGQNWGEQIIMADEARFGRGKYGPVLDGSQTIPIPGGGNKIVYHYHDGYMFLDPADIAGMYNVKFADITRIQLLTYSDHCAIRLYKSGSLGGWLLNKMVCENTPEQYNRLLSAFLVLCPNVK